MQGLAGFGGLDLPWAGLSFASLHLVLGITLYTVTTYRSNKGHSETVSKLLKATLLTLDYLFKRYCLSWIPSSLRMGIGLVLSTAMTRATSTCPSELSVACVNGVFCLLPLGLRH